VDLFHERLARIAFGAGEQLGLVLAGGYAISAHGLTSRPSRDLDFATSSELSLDLVTERLAAVYRAAGFVVQTIETAPTMSRIEVRDDRLTCEVDLLKVGMSPPVLLGIGPVLARDDAVGLKVGAMFDRGTHRDFIDVHAAHVRGGYSLRQLERLGAAHLPDFALDELVDRLDSIGALSDGRFSDYGISDDEVADIRRWASVWADDVRHRRTTDDAGHPSATGTPDWDSYLDS
jgi:hypothetical protein